MKAATVASAVAEGYGIEQEGQFQIVFQKNMTGVGGFMTSLLLSPSACTSFSPRWLFTVMFIPSTDGVTVTTHTEQEHADTLCRPARQNYDKMDVRHATAFLETIRGKAEQMQQATSPKQDPQPPQSVPASQAGPPRVDPSHLAAAQPPAQTVDQPAPVVATREPAPQPPSSITVSMDQDQSLGEVARRARAKKAKQEAEVAPKKEDQ